MSNSMPRTSHILCAAAALLALGGKTQAHAQQPQGGVVTGIIAGSDDAPVATASVELYAHADSSLAAGAMSDPAGRFRVEGLRPGKYRLRVMYIGYQPHMQDLEVSPTMPNVELGRIRLAAAAIGIDAVEVNAERGPISVEVDRTVYNARQAGVAGGSASDVLRNVPGVDVDIDGKVSLRGTGNVAVQINGRAAPVQGDALAHFLKQLPASTVDRVEVVPNPSARYDPEGMGGIINIVMLQNTDLGLSGGVNLTAGTGDKYNGSGNIGYQAGRLTLVGTLGVNDDIRNTETYIFRSLDLNGARSYQQQNTHGDLHNQGLTLNGSAEVKVSRHGTLAAGLTMNRMRGDIGLSNRFRFFDADRELADLRDEGSLLDQTVDIADASLSYRHVVAPAANELTTELRYHRSDDALLTLFGDAPLTVARSEGQRVSGLAGNLTVQTDVIRRAAGMKVELGQKFTFRGLDHGRSVLRSAAAPHESTHDERILAGYALLNRDVGSFSLQGGLRVEHTTTDLRFSESGRGGDQLSNHYLNYFPSAAALYSFSDSRKVRLSYARRIQRPNSRFLNPFPAMEDPRNLMVGNPELRPEMTDAIELSLQQTGSRGSLQVQPFLRRTTDAIRVTKTVDPNGIATTSFANLNTATTYGSDVTATARAGTRLNGMLGFSVFQLTTEGVTDLGSLSSETLTWNARGSLSWTIRPQTNAQMTLFHRAPMNMEQGRVRALTVTTFALQQKLLADRASVTLRVSDPLDAMRMSFTTADATHDQTSWRKIESRIAQLSFAWSFGKQPRIRPLSQQEQAAQVPIF